MKRESKCPQHQGVDHQSVDTGLQAYQGKIAIGSGKFDGRGFMNGIQSRLNYIPEKQTDYIYAVIVEELGFLGGLSVIGLYGMMLYRFIEISKSFL